MNRTEKHELNENININDHLSLCEEFLNLEIEQQHIVCPYWMNNNSGFVDTDLYKSVPGSGKFTPTQIISQTSEILNQLYSSESEKFSSERIRQIMTANGIGVDCSGFCFQILERIAINQGMPNFSDEIIGVNGKKGIRKVNADCLTSELNSVRITNINEIKTGDLIRCGGGSHVICILSNQGYFLDCAQSAFSNANSGVSRFKIILDNDNGNIFNQTWTELDNNNLPYNYKLLNSKHETDGIRRLKIFL